MRPQGEIHRAIAHIEEAIMGAVLAGDAHALEAMVAVIKTLRWSLGIDEPGGFGELISRLDEVDRQRSTEAS